MTGIYLLRHGETEWNREEIFRGRSDIPLSDHGCRQAAALGKALAAAGLEDPVFVSGPLSRARETARIAAAACGSTDGGIREEEAFNDISFGEWEGKTLPQVASEYPELFKLWRESPQKVVFPGGESLDGTAARAEAALCRLAGSFPGKDLVIVSHRAVNKALLLRLLGFDSSAFWRLQQNTACLNELKYTGPEFIIVRLNDTCHLQDLGRDKSDF